MYKQFGLTFLITLFTSYALSEFFFDQLTKEQESLDAKQTNIILENVQDRFKLFLDTPLSIGIIGADYFSQENLLNPDYHPFAKNLLKSFPEILGLNILAADGKIMRVYPQDQNSPALGKVTQNFDAIVASFKREEQFWLSSPFKLYQDGLGFAFYIPIVHKEKILGWFAPVVTTEMFYKKFKLYRYLESYELIIKDEKTALEYLATARVPDPKIQIYETKRLIHNRSLVFQSWKKDNLAGDISYLWSVGIALFMSCLACLIFWLYEHRQKTKNQLKNISSILRLSAKDALGNLIDISHEMKDSSGVNKRNMNYTVNLLEQIDLLQSMSQSKEGPIYEKNLFLPLLRSQIENLSEVSKKNNLRFDFKEENLSGISICVNRWLFENCVLFNILSHSILHSEPKTTIFIDALRIGKTDTISFTSKKGNSLGEQNSALERRMELVKKVLQIYGGDLMVRNDLAQDLLIRLMLPITDEK